MTAKSSRYAAWAKTPEARRIIERMGPASTEAAFRAGESFDPSKPVPTAPLRSVPKPPSAGVQKQIDATKDAAVAQKAARPKPPQATPETSPVSQDK